MTRERTLSLPIASLVLLAACGTGPSDDARVASAQDALRADARRVEPPDPPLPAAGCAASNGVCVPRGSCAPAGGSTAPSVGGCAFDDGPAECCVPPPAQPHATTCAAQGAVCAPVGGCLDAGGWFTASDASGCSGLYVCCQPRAACGAPTIDCCDGATVYRPACDHGLQTCVFGHAAPIGACPAAQRRR